MPRILNPRKVPLTRKELRERANKIQTRRNFVWIDPFTEIPGTLPEKMVYAELVRRGIPFKFQEWLYVDLPIDSNKWYRPDFTLPDLKIIIEVQGAYFHTKPEQLEQDSLKYALYQLLGWKILLWWDYDIQARLQDLFDKEPLLGFRTTNRQAPYPMTGRVYDDAKGIRKANQKRRKPWTHKAVKVKVKRRRK